LNLNLNRTWVLSEWKWTCNRTSHGLGNTKVYFISK